MLIQPLFEHADGYSNMNQVSFQTEKCSFSIPLMDKTKFGHRQDIFKGGGRGNPVFRVGMLANEYAYKFPLKPFKAILLISLKYSG
jgi:hypothetical protein